MKIIPWHCHVCGSTFDTPNGGLCSRCNKAACRSCLILDLNKKQVESKETSGYVCPKCATPEELKNAPPFKKFRFGSTKSDVNNKHLKRASSILRKIAIIVVILLVFGFLMDLFSGFYVLKHAKSIYAGLAALFILAIFYVIGEAGSEWIGEKDDVAHPLYKRAFHLLVLLLFAGLVLTVMWLVLKYLGLLRI